MSFIPKQLKHPWPLTPVCIFSLALGLLLLSFLLPDAYPEIHDRIQERHLTVAVAIIGIACTALPIMLLRWCIRNENLDC